jgi:hypothetical protein
LSAHHATEAGGARELRDQLEPDLGIGVRLRAGENVESQGEQPVAGKNGGRLVECLVRGRATASQVVVVHGGQIVVYQRIAVHAFQRRARHQHSRGRRRAAPRTRPPGTGGTACRRRGSRSAWRRAAAPAGPARHRPGSTPAIGPGALPSLRRLARGDLEMPPGCRRPFSQHQCGPCFTPAMTAIYQGACFRPTCPSPIH